MIPDPKLDKEALALLSAATGEPFAAFPAQEGIAAFWRRAALKARELHADATPRFVVMKATKRTLPFWIVHDRKKDRVYPFGFGRSGEYLARQAAKDLTSGKKSFYLSDPNTKNYL